MVFDPVNEGSKVKAALSVSAFPANAAVVAGRITEHWLFYNVDALPTAPGSHCVPASFRRFSVLVARL